MDCISMIMTVGLIPATVKEMTTADAISVLKQPVPEKRIPEIFITHILFLTRGRQENCTMNLTGYCDKKYFFTLWSLNY